MEDFVKELSKHYLGIAAAILIALLIALIVKEPGVTLLRIIIGAILYFLLLLFAMILYKFSIKFKKSIGEKNVQ